MSDNLEDILPEGAFPFSYNAVKVCIFEYIDKEGVSIGFLSAFPDLREDKGGMIRHCHPERNSLIWRQYNNKKELWGNFARVRDITEKRVGFTLLYEGNQNYG